MASNTVKEIASGAAPCVVAMRDVTRSFVERLWKQRRRTTACRIAPCSDASRELPCPLQNAAPTAMRPRSWTCLALAGAITSSGSEKCRRVDQSVHNEVGSMNGKQQCRLTVRDAELLATLCISLRMASLDQIARAWWGTSLFQVAACRRRLTRLKRYGLLGSAQTTLLDMPPLRRPLATWRPHEKNPDLAAVAWRLHNRWSAGYRRATIYLPTPAASRRFGGSRTGRIKRPFQVAHDIGVAEMYFAVRQLRPAAVSLWIGEDRLAPDRRRQKLPDAILAARPADKPLLILEFGGQYDKRRLTAFHEDAAERGVPYEIW